MDQNFRSSSGMGVVSGSSCLSFGTNWAVFSRKAVPDLSSLMAMKCSQLFSSEAGFLGVMLFGIKKVGLSCISSRPAWWRPDARRPLIIGGE